MAVRLDAFGHPIYVTSSTHKVSEVNKYYYSIYFTLIDRTDNSQLLLNQSLKAMRISIDYNRYVFPIFIIQVSLSNEYYKIIRDHDIDIKIDMYKLLLHNDSEPDQNTVFDTIPYFTNQLFTIIDKNKVMYNDDDLNEDVPSLEMRFILFAKKHLAINKRLINGNYLNCRLVDILAYSTSSMTSNILIERPDNMTKFDQLIIPPINAAKLPRYLHNNYALYRSSIISFFNITESFIGSATLSRNTPISDGDYLNVIFDLKSYNNTVDIPEECGYKTSDGEYYYVKTQETNFKISDKTLINQEILGSRNIVFSKDEYLNTEQIEWNENEDNMIANKRQLYYDNFNNPYPLSMYYINEPIKAMFTFNNLDVDTFKPNKLFYCNINNREYQLRVTNVEFLFTRDTNLDIYLLSGTALFESNN